MSVRLFVGNLPYDTTEAELKDYFSAVAPVTYLILPTDRETGRSRNFAFVEFGERAQAEEAIRRFNNQLFKGRPLAVSEARPRDDRRPTSAPTRSAFSRPNATAEPAAAPPPSGDKPNRNFGPDAAPQRRRKGKGVPKSERAPKGPMREVVRGQFTSGEDDYDDDYDDYDDDYDDDGSDEKDFAGRVNEAESEDDK